MLQTLVIWYGIPQNPVEKCAGEYEQSLAVTEQLKDLIFRQDLDISGLDKDVIKKTKKEMKAKKEKHYNELLEAVSDELDENVSYNVSYFVYFSDLKTIYSYFITIILITMNSQYYYKHFK